MSRNLKITLFRMWAAGAVCFFAAWGRTGPQEAGTIFSLSLIVSLIAVLVLCDLIIVNPVIRLASGKRALGEEKNPVMLFIRLPVHIAKVTVLMLLIVGTYYFLNVFFIKILGMDKESVPVPLEPVLFGILYGLYYFAIEAALKPAFGIFRKEKT